MFASEETYRLVKESDILTSDKVATTLGVPEEDIIWAGFFDPAKAFKATIPRMRAGKYAAAGGFMEDDIHGSQQYLELFKMPLSDGLITKLGSVASAM
jgi:hypothetical protein